MRDYELVLVIDPDLTGDDQKKLLSQVKKIIEELKGKVGKNRRVGKEGTNIPH